MNIFVKACFHVATVDVPISDTNTYTRCCFCDRPIQISLDRAVEGYFDNKSKNKSFSSEYKSFTDYFNNGFICEQCAEAEED